ncbi:amidohydrolase [Dehalococcoidia bacterium]|nr:amidohydrolase [Dehalococcoidia bacterium]
MAPEFKLISADDHIQETPEVWTDRLSKDWGDKAPHVAKQSDGSDRWVVNGNVITEHAGASTPVARAGALNKDPFTDPKVWADVPKAAYEPTERLRAMDKDSITGSVLYPNSLGTSGNVLSSIEDASLEKATVMAYNDWLAETWTSASPRFATQCLIPVTSVEDAAAELDRAIGLGHKGVTIPAAPWKINSASTHLHDPYWDPLWGKAQELGIPVSFHSGSAPNILLRVFEEMDPAIAKGFDMVRQPTSTGMVLGRFLFSGIGERFPNVKFVFASGGIDWMAFLLEVADHEWERICLKGEQPFEMQTAPTEIFHRQCHVTTWFENVGLRLRHLIGVENILWASEFPLETSTYPNSSQMVEKNFADVPDVERDKILYGNTSKLYGLN